MMQQLPVSFTSYNTQEIQGGFNPLGEYRYENPIDEEEKVDLLGLVSWRDIYSSCTKNDRPLPPPPPPPQPSVSNCNILDNYLFSNANFSSGPIKEILARNTLQPETSILKQHCSSDLDSLDLLRNYASGFTKSNREKQQNGEDETGYEDQKFSTEEIIRMGGERYIECTIQGVDHNLMYMHPYGPSFSGLSIEQIRDVDLGHFLLAAAEKVGYQQFDRASTLLAHCERLASDTGNPVQRVIYYFAQALRERIGRETGKIITRKIQEKEKHGLPFMGTSTNLVFLKFHQEMPFNQVTVFTGIQAILERVEKENKIHIIDFQIRSGVQWTAFIQDLAERSSNPIQRLKITAIALADSQKVKETGKHLEAFAKSLNVPFSYSIIIVSDMQDLRKEHFQIKSREAIVVYCPIILRTMISRPYCLQHVMRVIKNLNPSMMVVTEIEANLNSPSFFNRFIETLFFYSAYFDCLEDCSDRDNHYRSILERIFFGDGINNIVAAEGEERFTRSVKMSVWGTFFQKFGMMPLEISKSSLYRANLLMETFACKSSCNIEKKGNCLTVSWKKTPIQTISAWKFCSGNKG